MNQRLILVRHGQSQANVDGVLESLGDSPLTETGHAQARALAAVPGRVLLLLDTCHAGNAMARGSGDFTRFVNELSGAERGVVVMPGVETTQLVPFLMPPGDTFPRVIGHFNFWPMPVDTAAFQSAHRTLHDLLFHHQDAALLRDESVSHLEADESRARAIRQVDQQLAARGLQRRFAVTATAFSALPAFLRGTDLLATVPGLLDLHSFAGLASCEPPVPCPPMPMYAIWHVRYQQDEAHQWLRAQLDAVAAQLRDRFASRQR